MRYYLGVDWADQTHAVWVVDEQGAKVASRAVPHTAAGLSEWGRELDEWRAQGFELWAAIERPEGRVVDFLLALAAVVTPCTPRRWAGLGIGFGLVRPRATRSTRECWPSSSARIPGTFRPCSRVRRRPRSSSTSRRTTDGRFGSRHAWSTS